MPKQAHDWWQFAKQADQIYRDALRGENAPLAAYNILRDGDLELRYLKTLASLYFPKANFRGRAIDVGCGSGHMTQALADFGYKAIGIDLSPAAIELAQRTHPACNFVISDGASPLPLPDGDPLTLVMFRCFQPFMRVSDVEAHFGILKSYLDILHETGVAVIMNPFPSMMDYTALHQRLRPLGFSLTGPFFPHINKRLRFIPPSKSALWLCSTAADAYGRLRSLHLVGIHLIARL